MTTPQKLAIILGWLMLDIAALAQTTSNGNVVSVGQVSNGGGGGGPMQTYAARTDVCVTGLETGCSGLGLSFQMRTTDSPPFAAYPNAPMNTAATDPDFHDYIVMATDWMTFNSTSRWTVNSEGQATFNQGSTMFFLTTVSSGHYTIFVMDPAAVHAKTCTPSTPCILETPVQKGTDSTCSTNCTSLAPGSVFAWSAVPGDNNTLMEALPDNVTINNLSFHTGAFPGTPGCTVAAASSCMFERTRKVQFTSDSGGAIPCSVWGSQSQFYLSAGWNGNLKGAVDGSVGLDTGGAPDWQPNTSYIFPDSIIFPDDNTIAGSVTSGTFTLGETVLQTSTGASAKVLILPAPLVVGHITFSTNPDGTHTWVGQTSGAVFTPSHVPVSLNAGNRGFQATAAGTSGSTPPTWCQTAGCAVTDGTVPWVNIGSIGGQGPGFDILEFSPTRGCSRLNTRIGEVYRGTNQGPSWPSAGSPDSSGTLTTDDNLICAPYGGGTCPLTDQFTIHDGGQVSDPRFANVAPTGPNCLAGANCACTDAVNANYLNGWSDSYSVSPGYKASTHDTVYDSSHGAPYSLYAATGTVPAHNSPPDIGGTACSGGPCWTRADQACSVYAWEIQTTKVRPELCRGSSMHGGCDGHPAQGYVNRYNSYGYFAHAWAQPSVDGHASPGIGTLNFNIPWDTHMTYENRGTQDLTPYLISNSQVPSGDYATENNGPGISNPPLPYFSEIIGVKFDLTTPCSPPGQCWNSTTIYRFAHNFNTSANASFNGSNTTAVVSQDGQFELVTTDMMGTRGSTSSDWASGNEYAPGDTIYPAANNTNHYGWYASTAGTSGLSAPNFDGCTTGNPVTCPDGTGSLVWTREASSCNQLRPFFGPTKNATFSTGQSVFPALGNPNYNIFTAVQGGTTYSVLPAWNILAPSWGNEFCDDAGHETGQLGAPPTCGDPAAAIWENVGPNDCRLDVMLVDLVSAH